MTHSRSHTVKCNGGQSPGGTPCPEQHSWNGTPTVRDVDAYVRGKGWRVRRDGRHICKSCWERGER